MASHHRDVAAERMVELMCKGQAVPTRQAARALHPDTRSGGQNRWFWVLIAICAAVMSWWILPQALPTGSPTPLQVMYDHGFKGALDPIPNGCSSQMQGVLRTLRQYGVQVSDDGVGGSMDAQMRAEIAAVDGPLFAIWALHEMYDWTPSPFRAFWNGLVSHQLAMLDTALNDYDIAARQRCEALVTSTESWDAQMAQMLTAHIGRPHQLLWHKSAMQTISADASAALQRATQAAKEEAKEYCTSGKVSVSPIDTIRTTVADPRGPEGVESAEGSPRDMLCVHLRSRALDRGDAETACQDLRELIGMRSVLMQVCGMCWSAIERQLGLIWR